MRKRKEKKKNYILLQSETNVYKHVMFAMDELWQPYVV